MRVFQPDELAGHLPEPALRYLVHAIQPGTPLAHRAEINFHGRVRLKPGERWRTFQSSEILDVSHTYEVHSTSRMGPIPVRLVDQYTPDRASSQMLVLGLITLWNRRGLDLNRAAHSRVIVESAWLPSAYLPQNGAAWFEKDERLRMSALVAGDRVEVTFEVNPDGRLREFSCPRWSNVGRDGSYSWTPFTTYVDEEKTFEGYTIPTKIRSTWWAGTEQAFDFFLAEVDEAKFVYS